MVTNSSLQFEADVKTKIIIDINNEIIFILFNIEMRLFFFNYIKCIVPHFRMEEVGITVRQLYIYFLFFFFWLNGTTYAMSRNLPFR